MSVQLRGLSPVLRPAAEYLLAVARAYGLHPTVTSAVRSRAEQQRLFDRYRAGQSKYPAAPPGRSAHEYGMALDAVVPESEWPLWNAIRSAIGFHWDASDIVHSEVPGWREIVGLK
jgi:hypothetical protein